MKIGRSKPKRAPPPKMGKPGTAGSTNYGGGGSKTMFKPGARTRATGPESGRNRK